jgi:hypothetical protein
MGMMPGVICLKGRPNYLVRNFPAIFAFSFEGLNSKSSSVSLINE